METDDENVDSSNNGYDSQGCVDDEWWETNLDDPYVAHDPDFVPGDNSMLEGDVLHASEDEEDSGGSQHEDTSKDQFKYVMQVARFLLTIFFGYHFAISPCIPLGIKIIKISLKFNQLAWDAVK